MLSKRIYLQDVTNVAILCNCEEWPIGRIMLLCIGYFAVGDGCRRPLVLMTTKINYPFTYNSVYIASATIIKKCRNSHQHRNSVTNITVTIILLCIL